MKPLDKKLEFLEMRASGISHNKIAQALSISKSTCTAWERELTESIAKVKGERLAELYERHAMTKEARIERFGAELLKIDDALAKVDYTTIDPAKLLELKLKFTEKINAEYTGDSTTKLQAPVMTAQDVGEALAELLNRIKRGEVTMEQAQKESTVLANILKAFEQNDLNVKITSIEAILGGR